MNVKNCRKCGKIFNYISGPPICDSCKAKMEEDFQKVKEYIRSNPHATVVETAEECEIDVQQIKQWIREERLELSTPDASGVVCEHCGKPIVSGRFCDECKKTMANGLDASIKKPEPKPEPIKKKEPSGNKMRFLGRNS
ncbi:flagellar operon protein TIGR03826 [Lachnospiraceae bacterium KH1T2]|jgi:flagellar operon protein (TIGR03826 family)|nr:flagellar operon protein TIGR03826 [Lachnospiraceae bacterium KH1T2]